ncbi:endonuclease III [bacterium]|nr:MAG: endonuclease III [bacterium]
MDRIRKAVETYPKAAMFELRERGFSTPFQQLVACILSIRTLDEVSLPAALTLFERAPTPEAIAAMSADEIDALIQTSTFHEGKSVQIREIARTVVERFKGDLPCDFETLTSFKGVGPKCANLTLGVACGQGKIAVDIHVHRVTNRWGYVAAPTPEATLAQLEKILPERYAIEINALLVPFGKHICTGRAPMCSICPILDMCQRVGVTTHR